MINQKKLNALKSQTKRQRIPKKDKKQMTQQIADTIFITDMADYGRTLIIIAGTHGILLPLSDPDFLNGLHEDDDWVQLQIDTRGILAKVTKEAGRYRFDILPKPAHDLD